MSYSSQARIAQWTWERRNKAIANYLQLYVEMNDRYGHVSEQECEVFLGNYGC